MIWVAVRAAILAFVLAGFAHMAATIVMMYFDDHHSFAATLIRSLLISAFYAPALFFLMWKNKDDHW
ncbi:hypothetical protein JF546_17025 [Nitratireductor aquimarinus]|uniref:hypothetical protein n=1 Tax=Nitratireductor aquimarinus TaxID=889300 RepID=UPI001A905911|nr:hypothetical protein [Nitratireductor aquimarinus]MBN8244721.1 hypothetical protein [Nitratireductor aquimarinus]MBY6133108.1 hypothetical protein [Nitratireductor aquimarinus]MCA1305042.1 hypothetical protein [Nitratireductor aquimarinus]